LETAAGLDLFIAARIDDNRAAGMGEQSITSTALRRVEKDSRAISRENVTLLISETNVRRYANRAWLAAVALSLNWRNLSEANCGKSLK